MMLVSFPWIRVVVRSTLVTRSFSWPHFYILNSSGLRHEAWGTFKLTYELLWRTGHVVSLCACEEVSQWLGNSSYHDHMCTEWKAVPRGMKPEEQLNWHWIVSVRDGISSFLGVFQRQTIGQYSQAPFTLYRIAIVTSRCEWPLSDRVSVYIIPDSYPRVSLRVTSMG